MIKVFAEIVLASDHDMAVRVARVVVVDRNPIELRAEVFRDLVHHVAREAA